jgi:hypothetical protein
MILKNKSKTLLRCLASSSPPELEIVFNERERERERGGGKRKM